jgi:hypothetical protein
VCTKNFIRVDEVRESPKVTDGCAFMLFIFRLSRAIQLAKKAQFVSQLTLHFLRSKTTAVVAI